MRVDLKYWKGFHLTDQELDKEFHSIIDELEAARICIDKADYLDQCGYLMPYILRDEIKKYKQLMGIKESD